MKKLGLYLVILLFAMFVWPTPYRTDEHRKVSRIEWALGSESEGPLRALAVPVFAFVCGVPFGYIVGRIHDDRLRRKGGDRK